MVLGVSAALLAGVGCTEWWMSFTAPLIGENGETTITVTFENDTDCRVITWWGGFNDAAPGGISDSATARQMTATKLVLEAGGSTTQFLSCYRTTALAGAKLKRAVQLGGLSNVTSDEINERIFFSDLPSDDENAEQPTAGTADPVYLWIARDYDCGDALTVTFSKDDAGQFKTTIVNTTREEDAAE
jgi:hypothetical protein